MVESNVLRMPGAAQSETFGKISGGLQRLRTWLLVCRPKGIEDWGVHLLFYFCALAAFVLKVKGVIAAVATLHGSSGWTAFIYFTSASFFVSLTFYFRRVSQRLARRER